MRSWPGRLPRPIRQPGLHEEEPFEEAAGRQEPGPALRQGVEHGGDPARCSEDDRQQHADRRDQDQRLEEIGEGHAPHATEHRVDEDDGGGDENAGDERKTGHRGEHRPHREQLRSHPADIGRKDRERGEDLGRPAEPAAEENPETVRSRSRRRSRT